MIGRIIEMMARNLRDNLCLPDDDAKVRALRTAAEQAYPAEKISVRVFRSYKRAWVTHDNTLGNVVDVQGNPRAYDAALAACRVLAEQSAPKGGAS